MSQSEAENILPQLDFKTAENGESIKSANSKNLEESALMDKEGKSLKKIPINLAISEAIFVVPEQEFDLFCVKKREFFLSNLLRGIATNYQL